MHQVRLTMKPAERHRCQISQPIVYRPGSGRVVSQAQPAKCSTASLPTLGTDEALAGCHGRSHCSRHTLAAIPAGQWKDRGLHMARSRSGTLQQPASGLCRGSAALCTHGNSKLLRSTHTLLVIARLHCSSPVTQLLCQGGVPQRLN